MYRHLFVTLMILVLVVSGCRQKGDDPVEPIQEPSQISGPPWPLLDNRVKPIPFPEGIHIIRVPNYLGSAKLGFCPQKGKTPDPSEPGVGGFACWTIFPIEVTITKDATTQALDAKIAASPLRLRPGDCVVWKTVPPEKDTTPTGITLVNFFDSEAEARAEGKQPAEYSDHVIGRDFCTDGAPECFMHIALDEGTYRYQVKVRYGMGAGAEEIIVDPELEVTCSGTGCGEPPDLPQS